MTLGDLLQKAMILSKLVEGHVAIVCKNYKKDWRGFTLEYRKGSEYEEDPWINIEYWDDDGEATGLMIPETNIWKIECCYVGGSEDVYIDMNSEDWMLYPDSVKVLKEEFNKVKDALDSLE